MNMLMKCLKRFVPAGLLPLALAIAAPAPAETLEQAVEPHVERHRVDVADIDARDWEAGVFAGIISVEDFGTNGVYGARLAYHVTEDFFVEASYGVSEIDKTSFEVINDRRLLSSDQRDYSYYNLSVGYNLFPGEAFLFDMAFRSAFYLIAGIGSTEFAGDDLHTFNVGMGYRITLWRFVNLHLDFRDHMFDSDVTFQEKTLHNLEFTTAITASF
jgi:outer membrane beta-barrel protein